MKKLQAAPQIEIRWKRHFYQDKERVHILSLKQTANILPNYTKLSWAFCSSNNTTWQDKLQILQSILTQAAENNFPIKTYKILSKNNKIVWCNESLIKYRKLDLI